MAELSLQAQAVKDAAWTAFGNGHKAVAAAALRAAADQVVPEEPEPFIPDYPDSNQAWPYHEWTAKRETRRSLLAIAAELEAPQ